MRWRAADQVLIPVQAQYLSAKGLEQLLQTISKVRRQINPKLKIEGILLTMVDSRTNYAKEISALIREAYGNNIKVFSTDIPRSVRAAELVPRGKVFSARSEGKGGGGLPHIDEGGVKRCRKKGGNVSLNTYADIFSTEQSRAEDRLEKVREIPLAELHPFKNHPFKVLDDESMQRTWRVSQGLVFCLRRLQGHPRTAVMNW